MSHTLDTLARTNLEFPLSRHYLRVDASNLDASIQTRFVVSFDDISAVYLAGTNTTVIRSLRARETALWPAIWPAIRAKKSVFLLETEPWLVLGIGLHQPCGFVTVIELVGASIWIPGLAQHQNIVAATERIGKDGTGADVNIGVVPRSLSGRRAVKVPFRQFFVALHGA